MANTVEADIELKRTHEWQFDLAKRQYRELRSELERIKQEVSTVSSIDKTRVDRINQLIRDADQYYNVDPRSNADTPPDKTPVRNDKNDKKGRK
jgi:hypothetical protein